MYHEPRQPASNTTAPGARAGAGFARPRSTEAIRQCLKWRCGPNRSGGRARGNGHAASTPGGTGVRRDGVSRSGSVEAQAPAHLVLVHDRVGVAAGDAGVVGQPVGLLFTAEERGARFDSMEPLSEGAAGHDRNARDETTVQIR